MNLMLVVLMLCVILGLLAGPFGRRQQAAITVMATTMTALYFFVARFI